MFNGLRLPRSSTDLSVEDFLNGLNKLIHREWFVNYLVVLDSHIVRREGPAHYNGVHIRAQPPNRENEFMAVDLRHDHVGEEEIQPTSDLAGDS